MAEKKYYWLKLKVGYFNQLIQKKMRKQEDGAIMNIIYLKMMLHSLNNGGYIYFQGVYDSIEEELSEEFYEDVEMVRKTICFLRDNQVITIDDDFNCYIPEAMECTGGEGASAERVRKHREKQKMLQCNTNVTNCNTEKEIEKEKEKRKEREGEEEKEDAHATSVFESFWNDTFELYPQKSNYNEAKQLWEEKILNVPKQREEAFIIYRAIKMYLNDYKSKNDDDENCKFVKNLARWLKEDATYWIEQARKQDEEIQQEAEQHINLWDDEEESEMTDEEWLEMMKNTTDEEHEKCNNGRQ